MNIEGGSGGLPDERDERGEAEMRREMEERRRKDEEIVSSVGAMRRLGGELPFVPTSEVEIPDIRMQLGDEGNEEARRAEEAEQAEQARMEQGEKEERNKKEKYEKDPELVEWRTDPKFKKIARDLYKLNETSGERERMKIKERLTKNYQKLAKTEIYYISTMLGETTMKYIKPYPYDSRYQQAFIEGINKGIVDLTMELEDSSEVDPEVQEWLNLIDRDCSWGKGMVNVLEGLGPMISSFWSGTNMMGAVREKMRKDPTGKDYKLVFAKVLEGLESGEVAGKIWDKERLEKGLEDGMRSLGVEYLSSGMYWGMAVTAVEQLEYDKDGNVDTFMELTEREIELVRKLFGERDEKKWLDYKHEGHSFPKKILNFYTMRMSGKNVNRYESLMESLLCLGVKKRIQEGEDINTLVNEVEESAKKKRKILHGKFGKDLKSRLAEVVVKANIGFNWGHGASSELGWGWKYGKGKDEVTRTMTSGSTRAAMDWSTERYWLLSHLSNKVKGWTFSSILPKFSNEMRVIANNHRPDFKPNLKNDENSKKLKEIEKATKFDKVYQRAIDYLYSYDWSEEERKWLDENLWWWDTEIESKDGVNIVIPMFCSTEVEGMNFWDTISLSGEGKVNMYEKGKLLENRENSDDKNVRDRSVWEELCRRKEMSEMDWEGMENQEVYTWMITLSQLLFKTTVLLQEETRGNKEGFEKFFESSDRLRELLKRGILGDRDSKGPKVMTAISYAGVIVPSYVAKNNAKIMGEYGNDDDRQGQFVRYMSEWIDEAEGLWIKGDGLIPEEEPEEELKNGSERLAHMLRFYTALISEMGYVLGENKRNELNEVYKGTKDSVAKITGRKLPSHPPSYSR